MRRCKAALSSSLSAAVLALALTGGVYAETLLWTAPQRAGFDGVICLPKNDFDGAGVRCAFESPGRVVDGGFGLCAADEVSPKLLPTVVELVLVVTEKRRLG